MDNFPKPAGTMDEDAINYAAVLYAMPDYYALNKFLLRWQNREISTTAAFVLEVIRAFDRLEDTCWMTKLG